MGRAKVHLANDPNDPALKDQDASTWTLCSRKVEIPLVRSKMTDEVTCGMCRRLVKQNKTWSMK